MMQYILDFSQRPTPKPSNIIHEGYKGVIRYTGFDPRDRPKCISKAEYDGYVNAGLSVALVYENRAGDTAGGRPAGLQAAKNARTWANNIGFPMNKPIYFAVDSDQVSPRDYESVKQYFLGITDWLNPALVGVYGEYDIIEFLAQQGLAKWFWQTLAWSHKKVSKHNHLLQILGQVTIDGVSCDRNEIHQENYGQNNYTPKPTEEVDDMAWSEEDSKNLASMAHDIKTLVAPRKADGTDDPTHFRNSIVGLNDNVSKLIKLLTPKTPPTA